MDFTFGIITNNANINPIISSIEKLKIPNYEIIIVCNKNNYTEYEHISENVIPFDESIKPNWITRKKNLICQKAKYDNIVLLHDYIEHNNVRIENKIYNNIDIPYLESDIIEEEIITYYVVSY